MFDIGSPELIIIVIVAIVFVGPKELPGLIRGFGKAMGWIRGVTSEVKAAAYSLANEVEEENDPYADLKAKEGVTNDMSPEEVTAKIMANREDEAAKADTKNDKADKA